MSTTFTDEHDHEFRVTARNINSKDCVSLGMPLGGDDGAVWREFPVDDAPAVALAILEAAGAPDNRFEDPDVVSAWHALNAHRIRREEDEERESEDAKALEFRKVIFPGIRPGASITPKDRDNYRAARKFFQEA